MLTTIDRTHFFKEFHRIFESLGSSFMYSSQFLKGVSDTPLEDTVFFLVDITGETLDFEGEIPGRCVAAHVKLEYAMHSEDYPAKITIRGYNWMKNGKHIIELATTLSRLNYNVVVEVRRDIYHSTPI